jgi:DNA modification methylase
MSERGHCGREAVNHSVTFDARNAGEKLDCNPEAQSLGGCVVSSRVAANKLYFGDNLTVLREQIKDESVDLIYLDPPFNSNANYNVLFRSPSGHESDAQVEAFRDSWEWADAARDAYADVIEANGDVALVVSSLKKWLGENPMMAYIVMMAARLIELRRVLKPNGSLYLHCDPTASHYLKLILDAVFGHTSYKNEIVWLRSKNPKGSQHASTRFGSATDALLFYGGGDSTFQPDLIRTKLTPEQVAEKYPSKDDIGPFADGPILRSESMGVRPNLVYPYKGFTPGPAGWRMEKPLLEALDKKGNLAWTRTGAPRRKLRPEDDRGDPVGSFWGDIPPLNSQARERLGYPTQKPVALLDRIIQASSKPGDVILDPFCGCGTSLESAEKNGRRWIGIDVAHYAMTLIEGRLKAKYPAVGYSVYGRPTDLAGARELARRDKYQFQWWAAWRLGSQTYREDKKGADRGIDGNIYFHNGPYGVGRIIVSVKGGENVGVQMVRDLRGVIEREEAEMGVMVTLAEPTTPMTAEASGAGFVRKSAHGRLPRLQIVTVADLLAGLLPKMPPLPQPARKQQSARKRKDGDQIEMMLPFVGDLAFKQEEGVHLDPRFRRFG